MESFQISWLEHQVAPALIRHTHRRVLGKVGVANILGENVAGHVLAGTPDDLDDSLLLQLSKEVDLGRDVSGAPCCGPIVG